MLKPHRLNLSFILFSLYFLMLFLASCGGSNTINYHTGESLVKRRSFKEFADVEFQQSDINVAFSHIIGIVDTFLVVANYRGETNLQFFGINGHKKIFDLIKRGAEPNEAMEISQIIKTSSKNICWAFDSQLQKLIKINLQHRADNNWVEKEIYLKNLGINSLEIVNDSLFLGCTIFKEDRRYSYFNKNSEITAKVGHLPPFETSWPKSNPGGKLNFAAISYSAMLAKNDSTNKVIILYQNSDRAEFYRNDSLACVLQGPKQFGPIFNLKKVANDAYLPEKCKQTKFGFVGFSAGRKYLYALYSGRHSGEANKVMIFDWNGNQVKELFLNTSVNCLAVGESHGKLFLFSMKDNFIIYSRIILMGL